MLATADPHSHAYVDEALDKKTKDQLQELLREFGLPVSGNKAAPIGRLQAKYCALAHDIDHGSDDLNAQFDEPLEDIMQSAHQYREAGMQDEDRVRPQRSGSTFFGYPAT